jgi:hypothetical protein
MLRMITAYEKYVGYQIDIGSNATGEALVKHLSGRDKMTSLFHRDEVQGLFKEFVTKTYMAAAADQYTELYDGRVPVMLRTTGAQNGAKAIQTERAETNFIMYLMGITSKVAEILTVDYFRSGFLARFIYVVADAPERTRESEDLDQADEYETRVQDTEMENLTRSLYDSALWWQKKGGVFPRPIFMEKDALDRFNQFKWEMGEYVQGHDHEESIEPSRQRLALSAWKIAVLLAMYERSEKVQLRHVLIAIHYTEGWYANLVRMAGAISASEWQRDVDSLEAVVLAKGGKMRYEEAYAETMASIPRNPKLPPDHTMSGKQREVQDRINALAQAVEAAPGSTKLQLRTATGLSEWQFQRAIDRLVLDGRVRKEIDQRINLGHYWPITPKGTADT